MCAVLCALCYAVQHCSVLWYAWAAACCACAYMLVLCYALCSVRCCGCSTAVCYDMRELLRAVLVLMRVMSCAIFSCAVQHCSVLLEYVLCVGCCMLCLCLCLCCAMLCLCALSCVLCAYRCVRLWHSWPVVVHWCIAAL